MDELIRNATSNLPGELFGELVWAILVLLIGVVITYLRNRKWLKHPIPVWKTIIIALTFTVITSLVFAFFTIQPRADKLSSYITLDLVDDDTDDFGWISDNDGQREQPSLTEAELDGISSQFVQYPVTLTSTQDATGYSGGNEVAQLKRKLRNSERGQWDTLITTIYIQSEEDREISVGTYLLIPGQEPIHLGFGQVIRTNEWSTLIWREQVQSMVWRQDFYDALEAVRDEYELADLGHIRLSHILTVEKTDGTYLGFAFRLLSQEPVGTADSISANIYISSMTFFPN